VSAYAHELGLWQLAHVGVVRWLAYVMVPARTASSRWQLTHCGDSPAKLPLRWQSKHAIVRCRPVRLQPTRLWSNIAGANDHWVWHSPQRGDSELLWISSWRWQLMHRLPAPASGRLSLWQRSHAR